VLTAPAPSIGGEIVLDVLDGLASLDPWSLQGEAEVVGRAYTRAWAGRPTGTTHISVVDGEGRAAALSSTLGSGSGVFRGGAQLNNMLGELDVIGRGPRAAGDRLPSMMAPTLVLDARRPRLVLGSAGSVRLAGAIAQVAWRVLLDTPVGPAIDAPRIHVEGTTLHLEGGWPEDAVGALSDEWEVVRWGALNLYFGGVQAVERTVAGALEAAGDPRRGGAGLVVT
ncbi:MAG TPA: gamma-glutamyltransferase, partial [Gaiellaceae bacterium]|nr:gamma-glutamyltransferase [Gaiellaceae bacterium]